MYHCLNVNEWKLKNGVLIVKRVDAKRKALAKNRTLVRTALLKDK